MKKLFFLLLVPMLVYGQYKPHLIKSASDKTVAFQDTLTLHGTDSDTIEYDLFYGRTTFCNGYITTWAYPDTGATALTASDSLYLFYIPGNKQGYRANQDTCLWNGSTSKGAGLDWTTDSWYQTIIPIDRSEYFRLIGSQVSTDGDTTSLIIRTEWGTE